MPKFGFGGLVDTLAYGTINEILGMGRSDDGISRPNRYEVTLLPPTGQQGSQGKSNNLFTKIMGELLGDGTVRATGLKCESISMPGRNIDTIDDTNIYGPNRKIATGFTFADINATFQCSSDMKENKYLETWQRLAYNPQTFAAGYYDDYVGTIQVYSLDQDGNRRYGCELVECFPTDIAEQTLDASPSTTAQEVNVTFSYRYWKNLTDEGSLPKPLLDRLQGVLANQVERQLLNRIPKVLRKL